MKKNILLLCLCYLTVFNCSEAQIIITQNQFQPYMSVGVSVDQYLDTLTTVVNVGRNGGPNTYDFSALPFYFLKKETLYNANTEPRLMNRYAAGTTAMNLSQGGTTNYFLFDFNNSAWNSPGSLELNNGKAHYTHSSPEEQMCRFPILYLDSLLQTVLIKDTFYNASGQVDSVRATTIAEKFVVDGFGTLKLPGGLSESCLRLRAQELPPYNYKAFRFFTQSGIMLMVESKNSQPDTGMVQVNGLFYFKSTGTSGISRTGSGELNIFPNPARQSITIRLSNIIQGNPLLEIYNSLGVQKYLVEIQGGRNSHFEQRISLDGWEPGIYFIKLQMDNEIMVKKLILK